MHKELISYSLSLFTLNVKQKLNSFAAKEIGICYKEDLLVLGGHRSMIFMLAINTLCWWFSKTGGLILVRVIVPVPPWNELDDTTSLFPSRFLHSSLSL